jgi:DNA-binding GntR family transcriptional regulator
MSTSSSSLADRAYGGLREAIVARRLEPGAPIVETDLAEMLGVSRTPVREALRRCELEGYVVRSASGKRTVSLPTLEGVEQLFVLRTMIEARAVTLAAERISDAELARLHDLLAEDERALDGPKTERLAELNGEIHGVFISASRNRTLEGLMRNFQGRPHGFRVFAVGDLDDRRRFVTEHKRLVELLEDGDASRAAELIRSHLDRAREILIGDLALGR